jgi:hypothetical protein
MRMSMADNAGGSSEQQSMDVDESKDNEDDYSEALQDPAFIQVSMKLAFLFRVPRVYFVNWLRP